ncbi:MAG: RsmB/NOP family class I SAM-dependent RNA methyltransferase [Pseudomonadota bacterium]
MRGVKTRECAVRILSLVLDQGKTFDQAWQTALNSRTGQPKGFSKRDLAFIRKLVMGVFRNLPELDHLLKAQLRRWPKSTRIVHILRLSAGQILLMHTPAYSVITTALGLIGKHDPARGLVHAIVSKIAREPALLPNVQTCQFYGFPEEFYRQLHKHWRDDQICSMRQSMLEPPMIDLCVRRQAGLRERLARDLAGNPTGVQGLRLGLDPGSVRLDDADGYQQGLWWVQDAAAQLAVQILHPGPKELVLEFCAAPGGKTMQMLDDGAKVIAIDNHHQRCVRLFENLVRTGYLEAGAMAGPNITIHRGDGLQFRPDQRYSAILLDAPCSASGTIRRNPELPLRFDFEHLPRLIMLQGQLLRHASTLLEAGGRLVYCVCSLFEEEGEAQITKLCAEVPELVRVPIDPERIGASFADAISGDRLSLRTHPGQAMDGFYIAMIGR